MDLFDVSRHFSAGWKNCLQQKAPRLKSRVVYCRKAWAMESDRLSSSRQHLPQAAWPWAGYVPSVPRDQILGLCWCLHETIYVKHWAGSLVQQQQWLLAHVIWPTSTVSQRWRSSRHWETPNQWWAGASLHSPRWEVSFPTQHPVAPRG